MKIPYGRQSIDQSDIEAVKEALNSDWLTTGPQVNLFEEALCQYTGAGYASVVSSGTAALHCAYHAIGLKEGDEVILPAITFVSAANMLKIMGVKVVLADINPDTLLIDPQSVKSLITSKTKAVVAMDYAGQPCDYDELNAVCKEHNLILIADACHSLGAEYKDKKVGKCADLTVFSFHPLKSITTGEGGAILTENADWDKCIKRFRNHGMSKDHRKRENENTWEYEVEEIGFNYRLSDLHCALGISQLKKLDDFVDARNRVAGIYDSELSRFEGLNIPRKLDDRKSSHHLYVIHFKDKQLRDKAFNDLRSKNILANVHYKPIYCFKPYAQINTLCPNADKSYGHILSIPIYAGLKDEEIGCVVKLLRGTLSVKESV